MINNAPHDSINNADQETHQQKMQETKHAIQNILEEVEGVVKPLAKKVKYSWYN